MKKTLWVYMPEQNNKYITLTIYGNCCHKNDEYDKNQQTEKILWPPVAKTREYNKGKITILGGN